MVGPNELWRGDGLSSSSPRAPEERRTFRLAQLTLLMQVAGRENARLLTVDRLAYYDFFSANPFVVVDGNGDRDRVDQLALRLAGFTDKQLSYASTGERFVSRRRRLQHDLSLLIAYGLVTLDSNGYGLIDAGESIARQLETVYADAYREAARIVIGRLSKLSDRRLREQAQRWLGQSWLLVDLLDDVVEATPGLPVRRSRGRK